MLPVVLSLLGAIPAMGALNIMTNGPSLNTTNNWTLLSAPGATANPGSHQDLLIRTSDTDATITNLYQTSGNIYAQSVNITNGLAYFYRANSTNSNSGAPVLRLGDGIDQANSGASFTNSVSGAMNDAIYLANNSSLTILETNLNNATNAILGNVQIVSLNCTNGQNFNVQSGSTLTINALITGSSSSKSLTLTGGGTFIYGGNPGTSGNIPFKSSLTITNDSTFILNGVISNGSSLGVVVASPNSLFSESVTGIVQGVEPITVNRGLAALRGTNTYTGGTTIGLGTLQVFGSKALSGSSSLATSSSTSDNSTLSLATADGAYTMNQLNLSGIIIVTNSGSGPSTLTFTNGGGLTGTASKQIDVTTNITVTINGGTNNFHLIGATGLNGREVSITAETGGAITINSVIDDNASGTSAGFVGGIGKHGHGVLTLKGVNTYGGATTNTGGGTLLVNGSIGGTFVLSDSTLGGTGIISAPVTITTNGILSPGALAIGTLTLNGGLNLAGDVFIEVNKSVSPSNDLTVVSGTLTNAGTGVITVTNLGGTALALGNKFKIFSQAVSNGSAMTITGTLPSGLGWSNNLANDGTIYVVTATTSSPTLGVSASGNVLTFSWTDASFHLQSQTNALSVGLYTNWVNYPGGGTSPVGVTINPAKPAVFFRLSQ